MIDVIAVRANAHKINKKYNVVGKLESMHIVRVPEKFTNINQSTHTHSNIHA